MTPAGTFSASGSTFEDIAIEDDNATKINASGGGPTKDGGLELCGVQ